ncbi:MAG: septum formation initiator family protein, partial [Eubacteriales bacterium]|nr:septum formation initiator family protein [Eubacteriales bacterium]
GMLKAHEDYIYKLNNKIKEEKKINDELRKQSEYKNSEEYIEKLARDKLGMVKSNEIIFYDTNK